MTSRRLPDAIATRLRPPAEPQGGQGRRYRNVAKLMTRLQPRSPTLVPRKGSDGHRDVWDIEDGVTIAGALGAVAAKGPGPAFAVTVLCLRWWPEYVFGPEFVRVGQVRQVDVPLVRGYGRQAKVVTREEGNKRVPVTVKRSHLELVRVQSHRPALLPLLQFANRAFERKLVWEVMPEPIARRLVKALDSGELVATLMDEYANPNRCTRCHGHGQVVQTSLGEDGKRQPVGIVDCPVCIGQGQMPWGIGRRAKSLGMRADDFNKYVHQSYSTVLGLFRSLENRAARAVVAVLGD